MNIKRILPVMAFLFLFVLISKPVKAQACEVCKPAVNNIFQFDFPSNCLRKGYGAHVGGSGRCQTVWMSWWVTGLNGQGYNITGQNGFHPVITFPSPGTYQVCATVTDWYDRNGNGMQEPEELCTSSWFCKTVEIECD